MPVNYIVLAIPVFFLLIGLELVATRLLERDYYSLDDSINDLSCGMLQQVLDVFVKAALFAGYVFVYDRYRLVPISSAGTAAWVLCFLGVDFLYYWFHRMSHEVNAFWAAHVVHHQSEEYNLAVALRQGAFQGWFSWVFYLPLAWIGFPPLMFLTLSSFNTLYQFWIHTRVIGRLGPLEWVLNTPSNHRVHHGRNPRYIDRNHGGTLIVWDRLFGTYEPETEEVAYGITTPLKSWNPIWANLHYWVELWQKARRASRLSDKVLMFLKPPGWHPEELGGYQCAPEVDPAHRKYRSDTPNGLALYVFGQFVGVLLATSAFLFGQDALDPALRGAGGAFAAVSLVALGALLERKAWGFALEAPRLLATAGGAALLGGAPLGGIAGALVVGSLLWLRRLRSLARGRDPQAEAA